jgi:hypothetical protein
MTRVFTIRSQPGMADWTLNPITLVEERGELNSIISIEQPFWMPPQNYSRGLIPGHDPSLQSRHCFPGAAMPAIADKEWASLGVDAVTLVLIVMCSTHRAGWYSRISISGTILSVRNL